MTAPRPHLTAPMALRMDPELHEQVVAYAALTERTVAGVARLALREYLARHPVPTLPSPEGAVDRRPHSERCTPRLHPHGLDCSRDCPTCHGL